MGIFKLMFLFLLFILAMKKHQSVGLLYGIARGDEVVVRVFLIIILGKASDEVIPPSRTSCSSCEEDNPENKVYISYENRSMDMCTHDIALSIWVLRESFIVIYLYTHKLSSWSFKFNFSRNSAGTNYKLRCFDLLRST